MSDKHIDDISGVATTGHEWDGIKELNNPLPRWWVWTFYATIVWALAYTIAYPAWPLLSSATQGMLGYSSRSDVRQQLIAADQAKSAYSAAVASKSVKEILADDTLRQFASAAGAAAFKVNCVQCHGSGASGSPGFPNLNDDDWIWGGSAEEIRATIAHGIRFLDDSESRFSEMPAFEGMLKADQIKALARHVAGLGAAGTNVDPASAEAQLFSQNCAACHGEDGRGMRELGAPNLTDALWLYGSTEAEIARQIKAPRHGMMPAWAARLGDTTVKELAVYVHSLGGGE